MDIDTIHESWSILMINAGCEMDEVKNMFENCGVMSNNIKGWVMTINDESDLSDLSAEKKPLLVCMTSKKHDKSFALHKTIAETQKERGRHFWWGMTAS